MKLSPALRARLTAAQQDIAAHNGLSPSGWSDDHSLAALSMINGGHRIEDAVAIVLGNAVLENGRVDYEPGCAWIDFALTQRKWTSAEADRVISQWEQRRFVQSDTCDAVSLDPGSASGHHAAAPRGRHAPL